MTEADWQQTVLEAARSLGWQAWHFHDSRRIVRRGRRYVAIGDSDAKGFPDVVLARPGRFLVVELKTDVGRLRPAQRVAIAALSAAGVDVRVWRPKDWPEVERVLKDGGAAPLAGGDAADGAPRSAAPPRITTRKRRSP